MRSGTWILCLYPQRWRQRYEEEMVAVLEQHNVTLATVFDLLLGALDARLDPAYKTGGPLFLFKDERTIATTFLCSYAVFLFTMCNWHHYIPLSLSLTPYYLDMGILSTPDSVSPIALISSSGLSVVSSNALLAASDFVMQITLLLSNTFFIALLIKQAEKASRKRFVLPAILCLALLLTLPLLPLLGVSTPTVALTNPSGTILSVEVRPFDRLIQLYGWSSRLLWPLLPLLISSLFIAMVRIKHVMAAPRKHWLFLATMFYLILPIGRMLWLNNSVEIPSTILPLSSVVLGATLTYFPPFAGLATMVLALAGNANNEGNRRMWRVALLPATILSLVMLAKLCIIFITLPMMSRSVLYPLSPWNDNLSILILTMMLLVMFIAGGTALISLMRGFVTLKMTESYMQDEAASALAQSEYLIQPVILVDTLPARQSYTDHVANTLPAGDSS